MLRIFVFLALLLTPLLGSTAQATTYWTDPFTSASGLYPNWTPGAAACISVTFPDGNCYPKITSTTVLGGTQALLSHYTAANLQGQAGPQAGTYMDRPFTSTTEIWFRFYKYTTAFTYANPTNKEWFFIGGAGSGGTEPYIDLQHYGGSREMSFQTENSFLHDCPNTASTGRQDTSCNFFANSGHVPLNDSTVYCIEGRLKLNDVGSANGIIELYVTSPTATVQTHNYINVLFRTTGAVWNLVRHYAQYGSGDRYIKNLSVGNTRLGCGTPPPSDTTPPGLVAGLTAPTTSATSSQLSWTIPTDSGGSGLLGTQIKRCTGVACTPSAALTTILSPLVTYLDTTLAASTVYGYSAAGVDNAGNVGTFSSTVYLTTPSAGSASIAFDAVTNSAAGNTLAALPVWSHTVGAGANRLIAVCTQSRGTAANVPVVSVTYGGAALALARGDTRTDGAGVYFRTELWYLKAPTSGAANVAVTFTGTLTYGIGTATSFSGVDQTTPIEASAGSSGTGSTLSATVTSLTADAWIQDCALGRTDSPSGLVAVGSGQVSRTNRVTTGTVDAVGVSTVNGKTPAGNEVMDWTQGSPGDDWVTTAMAIKPAASGGATAAPVIDSVTRTATVATITYGTGSTTLPTSIRILEGNNLGTSTFTQTYTRAAPPFDSATATTAILTRALLPGSNYFCAYAISAGGVENQSATDYKCFDVTGLTSIDTAAPVLSSLRANGNTAAPQLPNGATTFTLSTGLDKSVPCRYDTSTHAAYSDFDSAKTMSTASLTASIAISSGVPAYPATQTYYIMCQFLDLVNVTHDSAVSSIVVSAAAPAGDTTAPAAVNVTAFTALSQSQATITWDATTDAVGVTGYTPFCSFGTGNTTYVPCANETLLTTTLLNLPSNTVVNGGVWAHDLAGNVSVNSNVKTITTTALPDLTPPSNPGTLTGFTLKSSVLLMWPAGADGAGPVTTTVEQCLAVSYPTACTDFAFKQGNIAISVVSINLAASTSYCWRIIHVDQAGNVSGGASPVYSNVLCDTTKATGLPVPRTQIPFGVTRTPRP